MQSVPSPARRRVYGLIGVALLAAVIAFGIADYQQKFTPVVMVSLQTERSGLLTEPGGDVRLHGVPVGEIRSVEPDGETGATMHLALEPESVDLIPEDVTASIAPNTIFGPKAVSLNKGDGPVGRHIQAGDVLRSTEVSTEANDVFANLQQVLTTVQPGKLNATLGAMAGALDGRGSQIGAYVSRLNSYLGQFNPHLDTLRSDITASADVFDEYARAAPDVLKIADNATVTSKTLTETQASLHRVLLDFSRTARNGQEFLDRTEEPLMQAVGSLEPTTRLLAEYSPQFTCMVQGLNEERKDIETAMGNQLPAIQADVSVKPAQQGYQYPRDLPKLTTGTGPDCYGLPIITKDEAPSPRYAFDDGTKVFSSNDDAVTVGSPPAQLFPTLFGPFAADALNNLRELGGPPK